MNEEKRIAAAAQTLNPIVTTESLCELSHPSVHLLYLLYHLRGHLRAQLPNLASATAPMSSTAGWLLVSFQSQSGLLL